MGNNLAMSSNDRLLHRSPRTGRGLAAVASLGLALGLLAGCGADGGDEAGPTTTAATTENEDTTTTEDGDTTETTETTEGAGGSVSVEDLEAIMPEAEEIGPDYRSDSDVEEGYDEPSETDDALAEACPEAARFLAEDGDDDDAVERLFETDDGRQVEIRLDPTPNTNFDVDRIDEVVEAVNACETIDLSSDGLQLAMELGAERNDDNGDRGVQLAITATMDHADFPAPITLTGTGHSFLVGDVAVSLMVFDGVDEDAMAAVPGDHDLLTGLADRLESDVSALVE